MARVFIYISTVVLVPAALSAARASPDQSHTSLSLSHSLAVCSERPHMPAMLYVFLLCGLSASCCCCCCYFCCYFLKKGTFRLHKTPAADISSVQRVKPDQLFVRHRREWNVQRSVHLSPVVRSVVLVWCGAFACSVSGVSTESVAPALALYRAFITISQTNAANIQCCGISAWRKSRVAEK